MHNSRLFTLVGAGITLIGLFPRSIRTAGEGLLPTLSQTSAGFPDGIPTIWGALSLWSQILLVLILAGVCALALRPLRNFPMERTEASIVAVGGFAVLGYLASEWLNAMDQADALVAGFIAAAEQGVISVVFAA